MALLTLLAAQSCRLRSCTTLAFRTSIVNRQSSTASLLQTSSAKVQEQQQRRQQQQCNIMMMVRPSNNIGSSTKTATAARCFRSNSSKEPPTTEWLESFCRLLEYQQQHSHCDVVAENNENDALFLLADWIRKQRAMHQKKKLSSMQIQALESIPTFRWSAKDAQWYAQFVCYTSSPQRNSKLERWINTQRKLYNKQLIVEERRELLQGVGFIWNQHEESWERYYNQLKDMNAKYGNDISFLNGSQRSSQTFPKALIKWTHNHRTAKRKWDDQQRQHLLTQERIDKLNAIQFIWDAREHQWNTRIEELKEYNNNININTMSRTLQIWINGVRSEYSRHKKNDYKKSSPRYITLTPERIHELEKLSFMWDVWHVRWESQFQIIKQQQEQLLIMQSHHQEPWTKRINVTKATRNWMFEQRKEYKKLKEYNNTTDDKSLLFPMCAGRLQKLISINFIWNTYDEIWNNKFYQLIEYKRYYGCWPSSNTRQRKKTKTQQHHELMLSQFVRNSRKLSVEYYFNDNTYKRNNITTNTSSSSNNNNSVAYYYRIEALIEVGFLD